MERRSSNTAGFVHFGGDVTAHVHSSHGVRLSGGSTGGIVEAVGDDTNVTLRLRGQGAGGVIIGNSSQSITIGQGVALKGFFSTTVAWAHAIISSGQFGEIVIASSVCDINPGDLVSIAAGVVAPVAHVGTRLSTVNTSRVTIVLAVPGSTAASTISGTATITWADLT